MSIEGFANLLLISAVLIYAFLKRERFYSEKARMTVKANIGKIKIVVISLVLSIFIYLTGEVAVLAESLKVSPPFPLNYDELHDGAEALQLFLLFASYAIGGNVLLKMVRDNGS